MKDTLFEIINKSNRVMIAGHINPDGDCIGACFALGYYIKNNYEGKDVSIYLEKIPEKYKFIGDQEFLASNAKSQKNDLFIALDCGDIERLGEVKNIYSKASITFNIDHHISNTYFGQYNIIKDVSSTCEILFDLFDIDKITKKIAQALYTGIIFDTGLFKHSNTTEETLKITSKLITYKFNFSEIIDKVFFQKSFEQNQLLGLALLNSHKIFCANKIIVYSFLTLGDFIDCNASQEDTEGIIDQLRVTKDAEVVFFLYAMDKNHYKVSLRSGEMVDVSKIAKYFGGGGHNKASGCTLVGNKEDIIFKIINKIKEQL